MLNSASTLGAQAYDRELAASQIAPETVLSSMNSRLLSLHSELSAISAHLDGTADRLLGSTPVSGEIKSGADKPFGEVAKVFDAIELLARVTTQLGHAADRLSQL